MNREAVEAFRFKPVEHRYELRDSILYALGLGYGNDPLDAHQLRFVYEQGEQPLLSVPSMCMVLGHPGPWIREPALAFDWQKLLHGGQSFELHRPLAASGKVRAEHVIDAVEDRGVEKGANLHLRKSLFDGASGELLATVRSSYVLRGDGGCGSFGAPPPQPAALDASAPSRVIEVQTHENQALLYRLSGDWNPLHADPRVAKRAGFDRPILHGLCTLGFVLRAAIEALLPDAPERVRSLEARFSSPVFPGERLRVELWGEGPAIRFRARAAARDVVVVDRGTLCIATDGVSSRTPHAVTEAQGSSHR